jgi:nitrite reductase/ring-hydroxylating ferredoxin subunit
MLIEEGSNMASYVHVADEGNVAPGKMKCVRIGDRRIALFNESGTVVAYDDYCTHSGAPVSDGSYENGVVTCPWHGAQFRVEDGKALTPPAGGNLRCYPVRVVAGAIEVEIDE